MKEIEDPCKIPFLTNFISPWILSRHIAVFQSERKFTVYFTSLRGIEHFFISLKKYS